MAQVVPSFFQEAPTPYPKPTPIYFFPARFPHSRTNKLTNNPAPTHKAPFSPLSTKAVMMAPALTMPATTPKIDSAYVSLNKAPMAAPVHAPVPGNGTPTNTAKACLVCWRRWVDGRKRWMKEVGWETLTCQFILLPVASLSFFSSTGVTFLF